ncbi:MAG: YggU family protein [Nitrospirae bacterium]|nr:YggU family protein [Nitrospirota bacterium]
MQACYRKTAAGIVVTVKVIPRASTNEVVGCHDGALRIKLTAPPVEGQANRLLIDVLYKYLSTKHKIRKSDIRIVKGETSKNKLVEITGLDSM